MTIDPGVLAFTTAEVAELVRVNGIGVDDLVIERLVRETGGWPLSVAWILRDAARAQGELRDAFERWRAHNAHGTTPTPATARTETAGARLALTLFGRFSCTVAERHVSFVRRRDQNVLTYLALAPGASASRAELLATFWPGATRTVASQGLRTAMCRLRRALAVAGGCDAGRYLRTGTRIALNLDWVTIDAHRFRDAVARAQAEEAAGQREGARTLYLGAQRMYRDELLCSEAAEPALLESAAEYGALFALVQRRLALLAGAPDESAPGASSSRLPTLRMLRSSAPLPNSTTAVAPRQLSKRRFGLT